MMGRWVSGWGTTSGVLVALTCDIDLVYRSSLHPSLHQPFTPPSPRCPRLSGTLREVSDGRDLFVSGGVSSGHSPRAARSQRLATYRPVRRIPMYGESR
jgi:hypothetical protein